MPTKATPTAMAIEPAQNEETFIVDTSRPQDKERGR
jgi:hypothetical protein